MENSTFCSDAEIEEYIEGSAGDLYDIVAESAPMDLFMRTTQANPTVAGTAAYTIYDSFSGDGDVVAPVYKIVDVQALISGVWDTIRPTQFWQDNEANEDTGGWRSHESLFYRCHVESFNGPFVTVDQRTITFLPVPQAVHSFRVRYIPTPGDWSTLGATYKIAGFSGWEEFVVADAAAKCLEKEESFAAAQFQVARRDRAEKRIRYHARSLNLDEREVVRPPATRSPLPNPWSDRLG